MNATTIVIIAILACIVVAAFLVYRSKARVDLKGPAGIGLEIDASNQPPAISPTPTPGVQIEDATSKQGGILAEDQTGKGAAVRRVEAQSDIRASSVPAQTRPRSLVSGSRMGGTTTVRHAQAGHDIVSVVDSQITNIYEEVPHAHRLGSAPPCPDLIIGRKDTLRDLKTRLGITAGGTTSAPVQILTAIRGWPGVGKTTVATALAHDPDIAIAFPDGVLWISLGQTPDLFSELVTWGRALDIDGLVRARTLQEVSARLAEQLRNKRMLLIVDDVWESEHALPFKIGGRGCAMLITTRVNSVALALAPTPSDIYWLPVLTDEKAVELLQELAPTVAAQHPEASLTLVRELEGLPLALQVAGRLLNAEASYGFGVSGLLADIWKGERLLQEQDPHRIGVAGETSLSVAALLQRSTDCLDTQTRDCFAYLGAFAPKPAKFTLAAMEAVWQVQDPKPIVRTLVDRGLLEPIGFGRFQMHALLVKHAKFMCTED